MNPILWVIISILLGATTYTLWGYLWKKFKDPSIPFELSYLYSLLISMLITIISIPLVLNNQAIPDTLLSFIIVGCFAMGFAVNCLINTPLTYMLNQIAQLKSTIKMVKQELSSGVRRILEILGICVLVGGVFGASVFAAVTYSATITATGSITGVGVVFYSDAQGQVPVSNINWGNIPPGGSVTTSIYVKSTSNVPITLTMLTTGWNPATIADKMTLTWNYAGTTIQPGTIIKVDFTLAAATTAPAGTSFSFNIIVTATG